MIENLVFLTGATTIAFGFFLLVDQFVVRGRQASSFRLQALYSLVFGVLAGACILCSHEVRPGVVIDARGAVVAIATIVGGLGVGMVTTLCAIVVRLCLGGSGASAGVLGLALDFAVAGLVAWLWKRRKGSWKGQLALLAMSGVAVGLVEATSLRWIGTKEEGKALYHAAGLDLFLTQIVCTLLMGSLIHLQRERRRSQQVYQSALSASMDGFVLFSQDGRFLEVNEALIKMTGFSRKELSEKNLSQLKAYVTDGDFSQALQTVYRLGQHRFETQWRRKDDEVIDLEVTASVAPDPIGGIYVYLHDITQSKQDRVNLISSEARFRNLVEGSPDIVYSFSTRRGGLFFSPRVEMVLGYTPAELQSHPFLWRELMHPMDEERVRRTIERVEGDSGFEVEYRMRTRQGGWRWIRDRSIQRVVQDRDVIIDGLASDITSLKQKQEELIRVYSLVPDMLCECDSIGCFRKINASWEKVLGYENDEMVEQSFLDYVHQDDRERTRLEFTDMINGRSAIDFVTRFRSKGGGYVWVEWSMYYSKDIMTVFGAGRDVTARRKIEMELAESEQRYRLLSETGSDVIWLYDLVHNRYTYVSPSVEKLRGLTAAEAMQQSMADVMTEESYRLAQESLSVRLEAFAKGDESALTQTREVYQRHKNGSLIPTETVTTLIVGKERKVTQIQGVSRDISMRKQAEQELRKLNRALQARSECAKAMVRAFNESQFLEEVCRLLVELGGYCMAWVGYPQNDAIKSIKPAAEAGFDNNYLAKANISWAENERGMGPAGICIRTHRPVIVRDVLNDPRMVPWRHFALQQGYRSASAYPLLFGDELIAALMVYTPSVYAFDDTEVALLTELANDVAFGVGALRSQKARTEAEEALRLLNQKLEQRVAERTAQVLDLYNNAPCGYHSLGPDGMILEMNDTELEWLGRTREETLGRIHFQEFLTPEDARRFNETYYLFVQNGTSRCMEWELCRKDGSIITVLVTAAALRDGEGKFIKTRSTMLDITERKRLEAGLKENEEKYRVLFESSRDAIITVDGYGRCLDCNPAAVGMFGFEDKVTMLMAGALALSPTLQPDGRSSCEVFLEVINQTLKKGSFFCEWLHCRANGEEFLCEISLSVAEIRGIQVVQGLVRDISSRKRVEMELRASEAKFRQLIEMAPIPIGMASQDGRISYLNQRHVQTFGYTMEDVPTMADWWAKAYPDPVYRKVVQARWDSAFQMAETGDLELEPQEFRITCKDGTVRDIVISGLKLGANFLATFLDITKLKQSTEKLRQLFRAVEYSPSMILITDKIGRVEYANPAWEQATGYRLAEVIGQKPRALKSGVHSQDFYAHLWNEITAGRIWRGEFCNRRKDGNLYWESCSIAPVHDESGKITHFVAVKEDNTDRRRAAEALRQAKDNADDANRAKSVFLANMSHEIRTPMNAILGFSQLLQKDDKLSESQRSQVTTITRSGEHLLDIINDILEMSRIESGRVTLNLAPIDLPQMLMDLENMFLHRTRDKGLVFRVEGRENVPNCILGDETKLRQILINLLGNAVKFTPAQGSITLKVASESVTPTRVRLLADVIDTGMGISAEDQKHLFEAFFQAGKGRQQPGGTGLGLSISRRFAQLMGGELSVTSQLDAGSTFQLEIEVDLATQTKVPASSTLFQNVLRLAPDQPPCRIVIADDEATNRTLLEQILQPIGFELRHARDGYEAVTLCSEWLPHLVLLDLRMPVMDGYEAAQKIRETQGPSIKIIALSASVFAHDQQRAIDLGVDLFLAKPFLEATLLECIQRLTGVRYLFNEPAVSARTVTPTANDVEIPQSLDISGMPDELVEQLLEAASRANYDQILLLVDKVTDVDKTLGRYLRQFMDQFDYPGLEKLLSTKKNQ